MSINIDILFSFRYVERKEEQLLNILTDEHKSFLLEAHKSLLDRPVDLEKLAKKARLKPEYDRMPTGIYGSLKKEHDIYRIKIRKDDVHTRQRFTFAHELSHYFLHVAGKQGQQIIQNIQEDIFLRSDATTRSQEWQANAFAAHILMPIPKVVELLNKDSMLTIEDAAEVFDVSVQAMQVRLGLPLR